MATSVLTSKDNPYNTNTLSEDHDQFHPPIRRSSGRRKPKSEQKKKAPQRGMGVEKLERLRQQEKLKKMTEICHINPNTNLINSAPFQFPKLGPNVGLIGQMGQGYLGPNVGFGQMGHHQHMMNHELSSTPNAALNCLSHQQCNACHKKKRISGENLQMMSPINECGFLGLSIGDNNQQNHVINLENQILTTKPQMGYALRTGHSGVEIVAVHRKGSSSSFSSSSSGVVMEYEFFPNGSKKESAHVNNDELVIMGGTTTTTASAEASVVGFDDKSTFIDLSLKL